jgi:signal transduction histidine kinase/ActR/RegA family two-component response regulator
MPPPPGNDGNRLEHCIRDLAALNALPSMCVGRSPDETLEIVLDALPTVLSAALVYLALPGSPPKTCATLDGKSAAGTTLAELTAAVTSEAVGSGAILVGDVGKLWCLEAEVPIGSERGRLIVGRRTPLDRETDRVLVRSAANLVGTTLEAANVLDVARRKDDFLAMLGHELRNPLAPILTAVELLARHPSVAREQQVIDRHTRHLARLVDDLLDISRVTRGHVELRSEPVALASALERAVEIANPLLNRQKHSLHVDDAADVTVQGDPVRLAQIFGNLLTNAAKFTPAGGMIRVEVSVRDERVGVTVRDSGRGIEPDQLGRIFEPFVQADRERNTFAGGLGLGLAIVKNLVDRHGGTISAESEGRGRGSAFTVDLPTVRVAETAKKIALPRPSNARAGVRVLVVDDNVDVAELLSVALEMEGFETAIAHDAEAALEQWRSFTPHAAVLDVGLPVLDGYTLARTVRKEHGSTPMLIAATGYGQPSDRLRAADAGFDCHFVKPVSVQDLVNVLDQRVVRSEFPRA